MKKLYFFLTILLISTSAPAQNCSAPVSSIEFQKKINQLSAIRHDQQRLATAMAFVQSNCLLTSQVKEIAVMFKNDIARLDFAQNAFSAIFDKVNVYDLYDAFASFSSVMRFHDFIESQSKRSTHSDRNSDIPNRELNNKKTEREICRVSDTDLQEIINTIKSQSFESTQLNMAKQIVRTKQCFTTIQIKQLVEIFTFESARLEIAMYCFDYCIDRDNYYKINSCFTFSNSVDNLTKFINDKK